MLYQRFLAASLLLLVLFASAAPARAQRSDAPPSVIGYGYQGLAIGALAGLGAGYLGVRSGGVQGDDWKGLVFGAGVGALTCAGASVALGLSQTDLDGPWYGQFILRDAFYGVTLGMLTGATAGGLVALRSDDGEHALLGAAIGSLIGLGVGVTAGALSASAAAERRRAERRHEHKARETPSVRVTVGLLPSRRGVAGAGPWVYGAF